jgi:hypothetical protein
MMPPRGFELHVDPMRAQIVWFATDPEVQNAPDLDNITKPFLDSLEGKVIVEDRIFHEIHLRKVGLNHQLEPEPDLVFDARNGSVPEFVYVRIERVAWGIPLHLDN